MIFLGLMLIMVLGFSMISARECNYNRECWDSYNQSCYYVCQDHKCVQIETLVALPPYPYCHCSISQCSLEDWKDKTSKCFENCKKYACSNLSCSTTYFNETKMECACETSNCKDDYDCKEKWGQYKIFNLSNGRKAEIKIMPETASQTAIERLGELNFTIELKEVEKEENNGSKTIKKIIPVYELTGNKEGRFLGIFKIIAKVQTQIDAETGEVVKTIKPWWAFLASGI